MKFILDYTMQHLINLDQVTPIDLNKNRIEARIIKGDKIIGTPLIIIMIIILFLIIISF